MVVQENLFWGTVLWHTHNVTDPAKLTFVNYTLTIYVHLHEAFPDEIKKKRIGGLDGSGKISGSRDSLSSLTVCGAAGTSFRICTQIAHRRSFTRNSVLLQADNSNDITN